jgi:hypothetical protein
VCCGGRGEGDDELPRLLQTSSSAAVPASANTSAHSSSGNSTSLANVVAKDEATTNSSVQQCLNKPKPAARLRRTTTCRVANTTTPACWILFLIMYACEAGLSGPQAEPAVLRRPPLLPA